MPHDLIALATTDPEAAEDEARAVLVTMDAPRDLAVAHQALAIVMRDRGRLDAALAHSRDALALARRSASSELSSDIRATYGSTLVVAGFGRRGLGHLDRAVVGSDTALNRMRRGLAHWMLGHQVAAHADLEVACRKFAADGDLVWEASARHNLGYLALSAGRLDEAEQHTRRAQQALEAAGSAVEALWARQNLGEIAYVRGDLPGALRIFDAVAAEYEQLRHRRPHLATVRSQAYLAAGLYAEAAAVVAHDVESDDVDPVDRAMLQLWTATAELADGDAASALSRATIARDAFGRLGNPTDELHCRLLMIRARTALGSTGARVAREAVAVATSLHEAGADDAPGALIDAARLAGGESRALLQAAAAYRHRRTDLVRASGWLARGMERDLQGDRGGVLRACGRGLDALDEHRQRLGSTELRALATRHGEALAALAVRNSAHDPRTLLRWSERWRSTALAQPPVTPGDQPVLESLAALRDVVRRLAQARTEGEPTADLERDRARLERQVRAEHHRLSGSEADEERVEVAEIVAGVGDGTLVELVDVDGVLHVLVVRRGRVRRKVAGTAQQAAVLAESARFVLRRSARGRPYAPGDLGRRLQDALLGEAASLMGDGPVVVVPTARLHGVPWALLPALADRPFTVAPSAGQWLRATRARPKRGGKVALLAGPGLGTGGAEVPVLAARHPEAVHLTGTGATVEAAMGALDGARLAHIAAHGRFRADSPLFSALEMADGPLTVHDLERMQRAPHRVVLSACESGVLAPVGAEELLGLASALFALGTAGMVTSVAEVNDEETARLMIDLHASLASGHDPAHALAALRAQASDPLEAATAASFVALGA